MKFGVIENFDHIDYKLPPDPELTVAVLKKSPRPDKMHGYCGCASRGKKEWHGVLYPKSAKEKDYLSYYVRHFNSIEFNATHYRIYPEEIIAAWRDTAGEGFKFCPKFPQSISHYKRLQNAERDTDEFLRSIIHFGDKLGPCFLQLSPDFSPRSFNMLEKYLQSLPKDIDTCLELRHPDWFADSKLKEETFAMLAENRIGTVMTDTPGRRDVLHMYLTTPIAFIRFVGNAPHPSDYLRIDEWVERMAAWTAMGLKETYFFMHQREEPNSPRLAAYFADRINERLKTKVTVPKLTEGSGSGQTSLF